MSRVWLLPVCVGALSGLPAADVLAQDQQYETPLYTTQAPAALDKNFGLPSFGMPGADLPRQKTMAPDTAATTPDQPDFFAGSTPIELPKSGFPAGAGTSTAAGGSASAGSDMETPLFTTSQGLSTDSTGRSAGSSDTTSGYTASSDRSDDAATQ